MVSHVVRRGGLAQPAARPWPLRTGGIAGAQGCAAVQGEAPQEARSLPLRGPARAVQLEGLPRRWAVLALGMQALCVRSRLLHAYADFPGMPTTSSSEHIGLFFCCAVAPNMRNTFRTCPHTASRKCHAWTQRLPDTSSLNILQKHSCSTGRREPGLRYLLLGTEQV